MVCNYVGQYFMHKILNKRHSQKNSTHISNKKKYNEENAM